MVWLRVAWSRCEARFIPPRPFGSLGYQHPTCCTCMHACTVFDILTTACRGTTGICNDRRDFVGVCRRLPHRTVEPICGCPCPVSCQSGPRLSMLMQLAAHMPDDPLNRVPVLLGPMWAARCVGACSRPVSPPTRQVPSRGKTRNGHQAELRRASTRGRGSRHPHHSKASRRQAQALGCASTHQGSAAVNIDPATARFLECCASCSATGLGRRAR
eukprot:scaffold7767_cov135-Isochrysis_galbana.AAC.1